MAAKEIRSLNRVNETTGNTEIFYPATTTDAVVHPEKRKSITDVVDDDMVEIGSPVVDQASDWNPTTADQFVSEWDAKIETLNGNEVVVVASLPSVDSASEKRIYRVQGSTSYTDYMKYDGAWKQLATYSFPGIDNAPTASSNNLVKSGGVFNELALGAVYDVSAKNPTAGSNNDGTWESLSALLSDANLNTLIPTSVRRGGMSVKFVQSNDNKYVQWRLMNQNWSTTKSDWQGVDDVPTEGSKNLVESDGIKRAIQDDRIVDGGFETKKELSIVDDNDNCIVQFKQGHVITRNFDSRNEFIIADNDGEDDEISFVDEASNCIAQFKQGHVKTKKFDSRNSVEQDEFDNDDKSFAVVDEDGNGIVQIKDGNIRTKNFDSRSVTNPGTKIIGFGNFYITSDWTVSADKKQASTTQPNSFLFFDNNFVNAWNFRMTAGFVPTGSIFEVGLGKYDNTATQVNSTLVSIVREASSSYLRVFKPNSEGVLTTCHTYNFTNIDLISGEKYWITIEKKTTGFCDFDVTVTDKQGNTDVFENIRCGTPFPSSGYCWGRPCVFFVSGSSVAIDDFSFGFPVEDDLKCIFLGSSSMEGNANDSDHDKTMAGLCIADMGTKHTINLARGGATTNNLLTQSQLFEWFVNARYAMILIGGNDLSQYVGQQSWDAAFSNFKKNVLLVQQKLKEIGIIPVFISPSWRTAYGKPAGDVVNVWMKANVDNYVNTNPCFEDANGDLDPNAYVDGGVHPSLATNEKMYQCVKAQASYLFNC